MLREVASAAAAVLALGASMSIAAATGPAIRYSPDTAVDTNPTVGYVEPAIAADPADARILVAAAESAAFSTTAAFVSNDGGYNWRQSSMALGSASLMGDVQVAANPDGSMYFTSLGGNRTASGKIANGLHVFASTDGGDSFKHLAFLQYHGHSYDHEQLALDDTRSRYRGNVYMTVLYGLRERPQLNACGLLHSEDRGRHFEGPTQVMDGWCFNSRPVVLSNGNVIFPFFLSGTPGMSGAPPMNPLSHIEIAVSRDGGKTFSAPRVIGTYVNAGYADTMKRLTSGRTDFDGDPVPQFAAHGTTVYGVWSDMRLHHSRLLFTKSTDGGAHWRAPAAILTTGDALDAQYQVSLAVNAQGILGVAYLQYRAASNQVAEMFAASSDGGATFSTPIRIQSQPSPLGFSKNSGYSGFAEGVGNDVFVGFVQPERRFPSGGDYVGMAVDRNGAFHPVWSDARTGTYQIWTASVIAGLPAPSPPPLAAADVSKAVDLQFANGSWDANAHILSIPVRIHNASARPLYPPFTVTVKQLDDPFIPANMQPKPWPSFANADNGQSGIGATYVYGAQTLGNLGVLAPGADSATRVWKIRLLGANTQPSIMVDVSGYQPR